MYVQITNDTKLLYGTKRDVVIYYFELLDDNIITVAGFLKQPTTLCNLYVYINMVCCTCTRNVQMPI